METWRGVWRNSLSLSPTKLKFLATVLSGGLNQRSFKTLPYLSRRFFKDMKLENETEIEYIYFVLILLSVI